MSHTWAIVFLAVAGAWAGALILGMLALRMVRSDSEVLAPLVDLFGTWAGASAILALAFGRIGFGALWAGAVFACALGVTAGLYDRAVLIPSLDAAARRRAAEPAQPKWTAEWQFLQRMAD